MRFFKLYYGFLVDKNRFKNIMKNKDFIKIGGLLGLCACCTGATPAAQGVNKLVPREQHVKAYIDRAAHEQQLSVTADIRHLITCYTRSREL